MANLTLHELLKPHVKGLAFAAAAVVVEGAAGLAEPWPLKIVLDSVLRSKAGSGWLTRVILEVTGPEKLAILEFAALSVVAIAAAGALASYTERYLTTRIGQYVMHDLRQALYAHVQRLSLDYHDRKQTGDLISRLTSDIDAIQGFISTGLLSTMMSCLMLAGMAGVMFSLNWRFTLIALSVAPLLFLVVFRFTHRIRTASREVRKKEGEMVSSIQEALSSIRVVRAFAREDYEEQRLAVESLESIEAGLRARSLKARLPSVVDLTVACGTSMVLWFGGRMALSGALSAGSLVLFIWYLGRMYKPMRELSKMTDAYSKAVVGYERIREVLDTDRQLKDLPEAREAPRFEGSIELCDVSFAYDPDSPVLRHVSLKVHPGQVAALVGPTGAGKTTVVNLIARFYDPDEGMVRIDGADVKSYQQRSLREQMSFVLQETLLFRGPVWKNIAYGKPSATRDEILEAARLANADEFIDKMPQGYDTIIGERGVTLSGGQRQRIAIARALIRNTPILILDEASTGLDPASEKQVFEALDRLMKGKTSIVIAHRLSTVRSAHVIFALKDGSIAETGTHGDLLRKGGLYAQLYELLFRGAEAATTPRGV